MTDALFPTVFDQWWRLYPRREARGGRNGAEAKFNRLDPTEQSRVMAGTERWVAYWSRERTPPKMIPLPTTFLNQQRYNDTPPGEGSPPRSAGSGMYEPTEAAMAMRQVHRWLTPDGEPLDSVSGPPPEG